MKWCVLAVLVCFCGSRISKAQVQPAPLPDAPRPQTGIIVGTVTDVNNNTVPGATVFLEDSALKDPRTVLTNDDGFFEFNTVESGTTSSSSVLRGLRTGLHPPSPSTRGNMQS